MNEELYSIRLVLMKNWIIDNNYNYWPLGRDVRNERICTKDRELAKFNDTLVWCPSQVLPVLLGVYLLFSNILLLNMLIAIFR